MGKPEPKLIKVVNIMGDVAILNASFLLAYFLRFQNLFFYQDRDSVLLCLILNLTWILFNMKWDLTVSERGKRFDRIVLKIMKVVTFHALFTLALMVVFKVQNISRIHFLLHYIFFFSSMVFWKFFVFNILKFARLLGFNYRKVIIVGEGPVANDLYRYFSMHLYNGFKFVGYFADDHSNLNYPTLVKGKIDEVKEFCLKEGVDEIYCSLNLAETERISELIRFSDNNLIRFRIIPDFRAFLNKKVDIDFYDLIPVLSVRQEPLGELSNRFVKRTFDIVFSFCIIVTIFPWLVPIIALLIKLSSRGPIFFKQLRSGRDNEEFVCYKFRTMRLNSMADNLQATKGDSRITWIGKILRKTNLDELPQFFNVLLGQMSVVGPRPHMLKHTEEYSQIVDQFMVRHLVKPGITGLAQINGLRGETNHPEKMQRRVQMDVYYLENWNFALDLKIIVHTVVNMVKGQENAF